MAEQNGVSMANEFLPSLRDNWPIIATVAAAVVAAVRWSLGTKWRIERDAALAKAELERMRADIAEMKADHEHCKAECESKDRDQWVIINAMHDSIAKTRESLARIEGYLGTERRRHQDLIDEDDKS